MVPDAFDHRGGTGVAHAETLPHPAPEEGLTTGGPIEKDVASDDVVLSHELGRGLECGSDHDPPARQALAGIVVDIPVDPEGDPPGQEGPEALAGRPGEGDVDGAVG